jgi:capsular exopolysaccharide synthesis family protein
MRTAVLFSATKAKSRTILVTSPEAGDGKTTVVSNLAITMAQAGQKTLVLEADFRKPMQNKIFGMNHSDKGLACVLAGTHELEEVINTTSISRLDILTCGSEVPNPSEMLHSDDFSKIVKYLAKQYDRIIVDSPPVLPVTDAQILASICQLTILVLRAEKSTRRASRQARDALQRVGAQITGVVVNDVSKKERFGYYGGDGYYNDSSNNGSGKRIFGLQKTKINDIRRELCARLGTSKTQRIAEVAAPKKKTVVRSRKSTVAAITSNQTKNPNNSESKNIVENKITLSEQKDTVTKHKEPAEAYDCT